jgi:hypothetical protein
MVCLLGLRIVRELRKLNDHLRCALRVSESKDWLTARLGLESLVVVVQVLRGTSQLCLSLMRGTSARLWMLSMFSFTRCS